MAYPDYFTKLQGVISQKDIKNNNVKINLVMI